MIEMRHFNIFSKAVHILQGQIFSELSVLIDIDSIEINKINLKKPVNKLWHTIIDVAYFMCEIKCAKSLHIFIALVKNNSELLHYA